MKIKDLQSEIISEVNKYDCTATVNDVDITFRITKKYYFDSGLTDYSVYFTDISESAENFKPAELIPQIIEEFKKTN